MLQPGPGTGPGGFPGAERTPAAERAGREAHRAMDRPDAAQAACQADGRRMIALAPRQSLQ